MPRTMRRDLLVATGAILLAVVLASVLVGNATLLALVSVAVAASVFGGISWARRVALALAILLAGAIPASLAHWVFYDHEPLGLIYHPTQDVVEGSAGLAVAALGLILANRRRPSTW